MFTRDELLTEARLQRMLAASVERDADDHLYAGWSSKSDGEREECNAAVARMLAKAAMHRHIADLLTREADELGE